MFIHKFEWLPVQLMVRVASFVWAAERTFRNSGRRQITFKRGDLMQAQRWRRNGRLAFSSAQKRIGSVQD